MDTNCNAFTMTGLAINLLPSVSFIILELIQELATTNTKNFNKKSKYMYSILNL